jgi:hypothetical protein
MRKHGIMILVALVAAVLTAGCYEESHHSTGDSSCSGGCNYTPTEYDVWYTVEGPWELTVADYCACDTGCGGYAEEQGVEDTITLDSDDTNIIDLQFYYTIENWGNYPTYAYVDMYDEWDTNRTIVFEGWLDPGESYTDGAYTTALDNILADYLYCSDCCVVESVHVYLGEQEVCSPVVLTYQYDGLYAEYY